MGFSSFLSAISSQHLLAVTSAALYSLSSFFCFFSVLLYHLDFCSHFFLVNGEQQNTFHFLIFWLFFLTIAHAQRCLCFLSVCACYLYRRDPAIVSDKWSVTILKEVNQPSELFVSKQGVLGNRLVSSCQKTANVRNRMSVSLRITNTVASSVALFDRALGNVFSVDVYFSG